jgi:DNA-directed RNA polymerase specialized sigma24 family protein
VLAKCNEIERAVFNAYLGGFSYGEIEKIFTINKKKIDNTIQKIKKLAIAEMNK